MVSRSVSKPLAIMSVGGVATTVRNFTCSLSYSMYYALHRTPLFYPHTLTGETTYLTINCILHAPTMLMPSMHAKTMQTQQRFIILMYSNVYYYCCFAAFPIKTSMHSLIQLVLRVAVNLPRLFVETRFQKTPARKSDDVHGV